MIIAKSFMNGIPSAITESAKIDGANDFVIFMKLILPLSKPLIATLSLFSALAYWNDWYNAMLYIKKEEMYPLQYFLYQKINGIEAYKKLWYIMFDRLMNLHKLKNLIWVWNGQAPFMAVDPNTYDIAGEDIYPEKPNHSSQIDKYREVSSYTHGKMVTLSECGNIPDPDEMERDGAWWLWWLPWWGGFVYETDEHWNAILDENGMPRPNPKYMDDNFLKKVFNDPRVVTLEDLPWYDKVKKPLPAALAHRLKSSEHK